MLPSRFMIEMLRDESSKAIFAPSGEKTGPSPCMPGAISRWLEPSAFISQISPTPAGLTKTIVWPSGDQAGANPSRESAALSHIPRHVSEKGTLGSMTKTFVIKEPFTLTSFEKTILPFVAKGAWGSDLTAFAPCSCAAGAFAVGVAVNRSARLIGRSNNAIPQMNRAKARTTSFVRGVR